MATQQERISRGMQLIGSDLIYTTEIVEAAALSEKRQEARSGNIALSGSPLVPRT